MLVLSGETAYSCPQTILLRPYRSRECSTNGAILSRCTLHDPPEPIPGLHNLLTPLDLASPVFRCSQPVDDAE